MDNTTDNRAHYSYLRVSTAHQSGGLHSQLKSIENYYKRHGITNYKIFKDENVSGAKQNRPALDKLMAEIEAGKCKQLVVFSFSRLSRSCAHLLRCLEVFEKHKTRFVSISESVDTSTAFGRTLVAIIGSLGQLERELLRERVIAGLARVKAEGRILGRKKTRKSELLRRLIIKGISHREASRISGDSTGSVSKEVLSMKQEMAKDKGIPIERANEISIDEVRNYFSFPEERRQDFYKNKQEIIEVNNGQRVFDEPPPLENIKVKEEVSKATAQPMEIVTCYLDSFWEP